MEYRKPTKKVIVEAVMSVLKSRGNVDTQTKMHRLVIAYLKNQDKTYKLSAERMRIIAVKSKKIKLGIRTRSVGAGYLPQKKFRQHCVDLLSLSTASKLSLLP